MATAAWLGQDLGAGAWAMEPEASCHIQGGGDRGGLEWDRIG
jgi:hypothetical protein